MEVVLKIGVRLSSKFGGLLDWQADSQKNGGSWEVETSATSPSYCYIYKESSMVTVQREHIHLT